MTDSPSAGPDFICIGQQKAATRWLYDQLSSHSYFSMPPMKELHFFTQYGRQANTMRYLKALNAQIGNLEPGDARQMRCIQFLREMALVGPARDLISTVARHPDAQAADALPDALSSVDWLVASPRGHLILFDDPTHRANMMRRYRRAFSRLVSDESGEKDSFSGDITPGYSTLTKRIIRRIAKSLPRTRILLIVRNPVDRFLSQLQMAYRIYPDLPAPIEPALVDRFLVPGSIFELRSYPSRIYADWHDAFGDRLGVFYFDQIVRDPEKARADIVRFLGAEDDGLFSVPAGFNRKADHAKLEIPQVVRDHLAKRMAAEIETCKALFGAAVSGW